MLSVDPIDARQTKIEKCRPRDRLGIATVRTKLHLSARQNCRR